VRRGWERGDFEGGWAERRVILAGEKVFRALVKLRSYPCTRVRQRAALRRRVDCFDKEFGQK
jgi:hypothetical protein